MNPASTRGCSHADHARQRRGTVYIAVLGFATLLVVAAVAAILASGVERERVSLANDRTEARLLAMSAVDLALYCIEDAPGNSWHSNLNQLDADAPTQMGKGYLWIDLDGTPESNGDAFTVIGVGTTGDAEFRIALDFDGDGNPQAGTWRRWTGP